MKCVVAIVFKKMISFSIKHEACVGNSVGYSPNKCSKVAFTTLTVKRIRSFVYLSMENKTEYTTPSVGLSQKKIVILASQKVSSF
jgi:hypothetical protein